MPDNKYTHIFIAYASKDQAAHDTFLSHLKEIQRKHRGIAISSNKDLKKADIVLMLISIDFMISDEYKAIKEQLKKQAATDIIPVLISPCDWELDTFLTGSETLPRNGQFVKHSTTKNERLAYKEIAEELREIVAKKEADLTPTHPNTSEKKTPWGKIFSAIIGLGLFFYGVAKFIGLIAGLNADVPSLIDKIKPSELVQEEISESAKPTIPEYGIPIFTTDTTLFKILIIRFEDNLNEDDDTYCIGRAIRKNLVKLETEKKLPITSVYEDEITSPDHPDKAKEIQEYHNADLLIYGIANKIQENCIGANMCFRHIVADTIMANVVVPENVNKENHSFDEPIFITHTDIEKGKLSVDEQSMENWVTGLVALKKGDEEKYFEEIEKMAADIAHLPTEEQASKFYAQANTYRRSSYHGKAIASYTKAIELKPDGAEIYYNRGIAYKNLKKYQKAISDFDRAIKIKPDDVKFLTLKGICYHDWKMYKKAIEVYLKAIKIKPNGITYSRIGDNFRHIGELKESLKYLDKAIGIEPDKSYHYRSRGASFFMLKEYEKAIADFDKAIELKPDDIESYLRRGSVYTDLKDYDKAIKSFTNFIKLDSNNAQIYNGRGMTYFESKEYNKSILDYDKAIKIEPEFAFSYNNRAHVKLKLNQLGVQKDLTKSQELDDKNSWLYRNWSIYHTTQKDFPKAIKNLQKAIDMGYDDKELLQEEELLDPLRSDPEFKRILNSMGDENSEK